ncbi:MAG: endolytic transglycosylase MltG [Clostridia bacterium]|nr:endolytic transglycosylase MltG [Clostridia bacterium]
MTDNEKVERLLEELKLEQAAEAMNEAEASQTLAENRKDKVSGFKLEMDIEDGFGEATEEMRPIVSEPEEEPVCEPLSTEEKPQKKRKVRSKKRRVITAVIYTVMVLGIALSLAWLCFVAAVDVLGISANDTQVDIVVPEGASTQQIAEILAENDVIGQPLIFRVYSRLTGADGTYQPGDFTVSANLGYEDLIEILQTEKKRESVSITFPEGSTLADIASLLERNDVCEQKAFYEALEHGDFSDYAFIGEIPETENRLHKMEGYLFPDTYDFYVRSAATSAVYRFLDNFQAKVCDNTALMTAMKAKKLTLDELVNLASMIQKEDDSSSDIDKVSRVFWNRLESDGFPKLQMDSTQDYVKKYKVTDTDVANAYDTYVCEGLPAGPICNPGETAFLAAVNPSTDSEVADCYYFASDIDTGITYYSETLAEHEAICRRYGIGMYG